MRGEREREMAIGKSQWGRRKFMGGERRRGLVEKKIIKRVYLIIFKFSKI